MSNNMLVIADNPSNPWLEEYMKSNGQPVFKYLAKTNVLLVEWEE